MPRITLATAGITAAALFAAPAAFAGTASVDNGIARYQAANGEDNSVIVSESPHPTNPTQFKVVTFRDVVPVSAGPGCGTDSTTTASCNVPIGTTLIRAGLEDLSDGFQPSASLVSMGFSVEGDSEGDRLLGTDRRDVLDGVSGNDALFGNGGNDALEGGPGDDTVNAGPGSDYVDAGIHDDRVVGGTGIDIMNGYYGDDTINADDGAPLDEVNCGPGYDTAIFDSGDKVSSNCEVLIFQ